MSSLYSRAYATVLSATVGAFLFSASAQAADMLLPPPPEPPVDETPVEFGSGWYLRGDVGYSNMTNPVIIADLITGKSRIDAASGNLGAGFQINNWLRAEVSIDRAIYRNQTFGASFWCPYSANPTIITDINTGKELWRGGTIVPSETCTPYTETSLNRTSGFLNAYVDLGNWAGLTPYVGAGFGTTYFQSAADIRYVKNSDGALYAPDLSAGMNGYYPQWLTLDGLIAVPQPMIPFAPANWNRTVTKKNWKFAWNLMAGVSYDIYQNLKLDLGYRFLNAGTYTGLSGNAGQAAVTKDLISHEVRLGLRVTTD